MKKEQQEAIKEATDQLYEVAHIPKENIRFYVHLFYKINEAQENSTFFINALKRLNRNQFKLLAEAVEFKWFTQREASFLWQLWQYFMNKEGNRNKFSVKVLTEIITGNFGKEPPKAGRRSNPGLEVVFGALKEDSIAFDGGIPHYEEISQLLVSLNPKWKGRDRKEGRYNDETLTVKKRNPIVENETLTLAKAYFDAKGEPFLPTKLPDKPQGHVKHILENLDVIPLPEPKDPFESPFFSHPGRVRPRKKPLR